MNTLKFLAAITVLSIFVDACKKPDTTPSVISTYPTYSSLDTIYQMLEVKPKYVTVNGATGGTFYGTSGTRYIIPPNCLQDGAGNPVTTNVQFEVAEYLKKGDMIFSKMLPISDGQLLLSGGQLSIKATLAGQPIYLKPGGCKFTATIPKDNDTVSGMEFFRGEEITNPTDSKVNWRKPDSLGSRNIFYNGDTVNIISDSFLYCNGDKFATPSSKYYNCNAAISTSGVTISDNLQITGVVLFDHYKAVHPLGHPVANILHIHGHTPDIPIHIAVFGLISNRFYAGITGATPKADQNFTVTLTETDPAAFKAQLNNLTK